MGKKILLLVNRIREMVNYNSGRETRNVGAREQILNQ
jgi:hypothetical protein